MPRPLLLFLFLLTGLVASAQPPSGEGDWMDRGERVRAQRVAYLTQRLQLTPAEAQRFWPLFTEYENKRRELGRELRLSGSEESLTESQAEDLIDRQLRHETELLELRRTYTGRFLEILPAKKLILLPKADREFKRELLQRLRGRGDRRRQ